MIGAEQWCQRWGRQRGKVEVIARNRLTAEQPGKGAEEL